MTYKLKDHVTPEMLVAVGFEIITPSISFIHCVIRNNVSIPLEECKQGNRIVQSKFLGRRIHDYDIQDLIELGYVEEMK